MRLPGRFNEGRRRGEDHIDRHVHELGRERGQLPNVLRPSPFDDDVVALDVAHDYGCIRMHNADVLDLYHRVSWGTTVVVTR
jgi:hypothetical protein